MYQWFHEDNILPGGINPTLTLTDVIVSSEGNYICKVSNAAGSGNSTVVLIGEFHSCTNVVLNYYCKSIKWYTHILFRDYFLSEEKLKMWF